MMPLDWPYSYGVIILRSVKESEDGWLGFDYGREEADAVEKLQ